MGLNRDFTFRGHTYKVACVEDFAQHPSWFSHEDESIVRDRTWAIGTGDVVFDVGAAYGSYSLTALACGAAFVYAWSPPESSPQEPGLFEESLILNGWLNRCEIMTTGVYDRTGWLETYYQTFTTEAPADMKSSVIHVQTLDDWRKEREIMAAPRYWMKLDVEGAEVEVFKGAEKLIAEFRPTISVENHLFKRATLGQEVRGLLESWGYTHHETVPYHSVSHSLYLPR